MFVSTRYDRPSLLAIDPTGSGDVTGSHLRWSTGSSAIPHTPSLIGLDGRLVMISDKGVAACYDATTGEELWKERIGGNFSASPLLAGSYVYLLSEEGDCTVSDWAVKGAAHRQLPIAQCWLRGQLLVSVLGFDAGGIGMANVTHCFDILLGTKLASDLPGIVLAFGDDAFLRKETATALLHLAEIDPELPRWFDGETCAWIDVHDELSTLSLFEVDSRRIAVVSNADKLVKDARVQLEKWFVAPADSSLLLLLVNTFPSNTKLFKLAEKYGLCMACSLPTGGGRSKAPNMAELKRWIQAWGKRKHQLVLTSSQAAQIVDAIGPDCGLLHQELAKLALYADKQGKLSDELLRANVGGWRTRTMWEIADAIADGRVADALAQLEKVFAAGEHPAAVIPQISWSLRRFGNAAQLILQSRRTGNPISVQAAIKQCGFWGQDVQLAEGRLRRMGLRRAGKLLHWLLELDLKIKGSHSHESRAIFALEELCMRFL